MEKMGDHFLTTNSGWFDKGSFRGCHIKEKYKKLYGNRNGPFPLRSETVESFHVTTSRQLNSRIVVPTAGNVSKFKPRLPKPVVENPKPVLVSGPKRPRVLDS